MEPAGNSSLARKSRIHLAHGFVLAVAFLRAAYEAYRGGRLHATLLAVCVITSTFVAILFVCDLLLRLCATLVDASTSPTATPAGSRFGLNIATAITLGVCGFLLVGRLVVVEQKCPLIWIWEYGPYVCALSVALSYILSRAIGLADWEAASSSSSSSSSSSLSLDLDAMRGLDYGTGLAYSFYYGYLRLVLPSTGTRSKGIVEKIENYEDTHNITFPVHRLFVLIPSSAYIPPDLKEVSYQWMESAQELEEERRNRAGNIGRIYRNNAYKIYPGGIGSGAAPCYVVVEGASPLLTFHEVLKHSHPESAAYKLHRSEIVRMFYTKLREILRNEPDAKDLCELIYYDDYDASGARVNVARIILGRISEIKASGTGDVS